VALGNCESLVGGGLRGWVALNSDGRVLLINTALLVG
jgi:hypothetical protein